VRRVRDPVMDLETPWASGAEKQIKPQKFRRLD
jgi:hypothetical protein